jgi:hypothetical protein
LRAAAKAAYGLKNSKNKNNFHLEEEIIQLIDIERKQFNSELQL